MQEISFTVAWTYRRPKLLRPRTREPVADERMFTVDAAEYRRRNVEQWRANAQTAYLADRTIWRPALASAML